MRLRLGLMAMMIAGCATQPAAPISEARHATNVAAAERAGYKVVTKGDRTLFCPTASPTGSHMAPVCMTEREFETLLGAAQGAIPDAHVTAKPPGPASGH